jgi:hypothetical protein
MFTKFHVNDLLLDATFEPYSLARSLNTAVGDHQLRHIRLSICPSEWNGSAPTGLIFVKF